jgi:hypothetical protein
MQLKSPIISYLSLLFISFFSLIYNSLRIWRSYDRQPRGAARGSHATGIWRPVAPACVAPMPSSELGHPTCASHFWRFPLSGSLSGILPHARRQERFPSVGSWDWVAAATWWVVPHLLPMTVICIQFLVSKNHFLPCGM